MRKLLLSLVALAVVAVASSAASAQCQGGACGFGGHAKGGPRAGRVVYRGTLRITRGAGAVLGKTRFFDGDGRPFRKAG